MNTEPFRTNAQAEPPVLPLGAGFGVSLIAIRSGNKSSLLQVALTQPPWSGNLIRTNLLGRLMLVDHTSVVFTNKHAM